MSDDYFDASSPCGYLPTRNNQNNNLVGNLYSNYKSFDNFDYAFQPLPLPPSLLSIPNCLPLLAAPIQDYEQTFDCSNCFRF